jgi:hypothetical protein
MSGNFSDKIPQESPGYSRASAFVTAKIGTRTEQAISGGNHSIWIHPTLKRGLPLANSKKVARLFDARPQRLPRDLPNKEMAAPVSGLE